MKSPNYPQRSLPNVIADIQIIWTKHERKVLTAKEVAGALNYQTMSGPATSRLSAIKKYGLLEKHGAGWRLSARALVILHKPEDSEDRKHAIRDAAHDVGFFVRMMADHPDASDGTLKSILLTEHAFTERGAQQFVKSYQATKSLVDAIGGGIITNGDEAKLAIGDYVQWTSQGAAQFLEPKKIVGFSDDGEYAFVEGERGGAPMSQLSVIEAPAGTGSGTTNPPSNPLFKPTPLSDGVPLSIKTQPGSVEILTIPKMTRAAFEFLKTQLNAFEDEIVADPAVTPQQDENHDES